MTNTKIIDPRLFKQRLSAVEACPEIIDWWNYEKNENIDLNTISYGSKKKFYFNCPECHAEMYREMYRFITKNKDGTFSAPVCQKCHPTKNKNKVILTDAVPDIDKYWDYDANEGKKPSDFGASSSEKVWTKCPICGTSVKRNIRFSWAKDENGIGHVIHCRTCGKRSKKNSLVELFPDIKKYWNYDKNEYEPDFYTISSGKKVYIFCPYCGEERYGAICDLLAKENEKYRITTCDNCRLLQSNGMNTNLNIPARKSTILISDGCPTINEYWSDLNEFKPEDISIFNRTLKIKLHCPTCGEIVERIALNSFTKNKETGKYEVLQCHHCATKESGIRRAMKQSAPLIEECPEFKEWWDFDKNTVDINIITRGSNTEVNLKCPACGIELKRPPHSFIAANKDGELHPVACPECGYNYKGNPEDNILTLYPSVEDWWDYEANKPFRPEQFTRGSTFKAHFICPTCGGKTHTMIRSVFTLQEDGTPKLFKCLYCNDIKPLAGLNTLFDLRPRVAKEWSPNNELKANEVLSNSGRRVLWTCPKCHEDYYSTIRDRELDDDSCPYCNNRKPLPGYNTLTDIKPELLSEWSSNNEISPDKVVSTSTLSALWICPTCNGEYSALVRDRELGDDSCPYCNNKKPLPGYNTLTDVKPELLSEWSPNNDSNPNEVIATSTLSALWICPTCNGEYSASVRDRELGDDSCPYCNNKKPLLGYNTLTDVKPELLSEWSSNNDLKPEEVIAASTLSALWICPTCNGEYLFSVRDRELGDDSCPYCKNKKPLLGYNTLADIKPELLSEWSPNNDSNPNEVIATSTLSALWICPTCNGEYSALVRDRELGDDSCPYCNNKKILHGYNTLQARHPELVEQEWCYAENIILGVMPDDVLESYNGKVWWKCPTCEKKYIMTVKDRLMKKKRGHIACQQCRGRRWKRSFNI